MLMHIHQFFSFFSLHTHVHSHNPRRRRRKNQRQEVSHSQSIWLNMEREQGTQSNGLKALCGHHFHFVLRVVDSFIKYRMKSLL